MRVRVQSQNYDKDSGNPGFIVYTRESGRLADHAITRGRNESERVNKIIAFTGQSLKGPPDSLAFMKLSDSAVDAMPGEIRIQLLQPAALREPR